MTQDEKIEWLACAESPLYFIHHYCKIYDATAREWIPFELWPAQARSLQTILNNLLVIILKARQLGMTWLVLGFALWLMIFRPAATILLFSRRDDEAIHLIDFRLKGMYAALPDFLKCREVVSSSKHEWKLSNGSMALAMPTTAGDSYTVTLAIADEFDLVPDQDRLMTSVKPTIDGGGRMILLSRVDKRKPNTAFKRIYKAAKAGLNGWAAIFLPWFARPGRTQEWYRQQEADVLARTTVLDDLYEQYPATDAEALAPLSLAKRIPGVWLLQCYQEQKPLDLPGLPSIPGLEVYRAPESGHKYVIGADPAEGNPTSDDSALSVVDRETGEEVAALAGKHEPSTFGFYIDQVGQYYNSADVLVERNNHGHAVLLWLRDNSKLTRLKGRDGKEGWHSTTLGKSLMYANTADTFRDGETVLHSFETYTQLASIEGGTLLAPEGERDDRADGFGLALMARKAVPEKAAAAAPARAVSASSIFGG